MADTPVKEEEPVVKTEPKRDDDLATVNVSDPEEDDLSDLDDVLDEFANTKLDPKAPAQPVPSSSEPGRPPPADLLLQDQDEFEKELQKEMEKLMGQGDFQKQFQDIMKEMDKELAADDGAKLGAGEGNASSNTAADESAKKEEQSFQESIRRTMERMQESGDQASAAAANADSDDILVQMLKEMEKGTFGGSGSEEDFSKILTGLMEQLTNKDVLYEPMKELDEKFPKWMEENREKVGHEDLKRYEDQQLLTREITARFEKPGYSDDHVEDREYIVERVQKMQAAGSPPPDLVGEMNAAQEALRELDQGCPTQ